MDESEAQLTLESESQAQQVSKAQSQNSNEIIEERTDWETIGFDDLLQNHEGVTIKFYLEIRAQVAVKIFNTAKWATDC